MPASPSPLIDTGPLVAAHAALWARLDTFFPASHFARADVPARVTPAGWKRLLRRTPFIGLSWRGITPAAGHGRAFRGRSQWSLFLAARNEHAPEARATGAATGPGLFGMTQVGVFALGGFVITGIGDVTITEVGNLSADNWDDEAAAVAGVMFDLPVGAGAGVDAAELDDFLRQGATWRFDPASPGNPAAANDLYTVRS